MCFKDATSGELALADSQTPTQLLTLHSHTPKRMGQKTGKNPRNKKAHVLR